MASYGMAASASSYGAPSPLPPAPAAAAVPAPTAPAGTFAPGTKIQVGNHRVVILKYLSEGGFAHVYLVRLSSPVDGTDQAVLKRVAVADKDSLRGMRTEVETMKRLKGHKPIVTYIDSHASELHGSGYEVFLLMEYCNGGGLIDFMNTRLQHRLTEPEILNIFADVAEGVACMHYLKPPLLHRDLKVENVLITATTTTTTTTTASSKTPGATGSTSRKFKLCDFGSAAQPRPAPQTIAECRAVDEDVQKHTTMQYRSPEMVDVYRKLPIDEKSDIWALGVLLYKLCYYTTPFEEQGQLAILNASFKFPSYPAFSDRIKRLIASMLREQPQARPNIYQVLREACLMLGRQIPITDIYSERVRAEAQGKTKTTSDSGAAPIVGAVFTHETTQQKPAIPEVERMRRGRLPAAVAATAATAAAAAATATAATSLQPRPSPKPSPKPLPSPQRVTNGDPFAALDARTGTKGTADELSSRFPTLDQFSLLHDHGSNFEFQSTLPPAAPPQPPKDISQRVAERLADEAFQTKPSPISTPTPSTAAQNKRCSVAQSKRLSGEIERPGPGPYLASPESQPANSSPALPKPTEMSRASAIISNIPELQAISAQARGREPPQQQHIYQPAPSRPSMVSVGTMTTPPPADWTPQYQVHRFSPTDEQTRSSSLPRQHQTQQEKNSSPVLGIEGANLVRPGTTAPRMPSFHPSTPSQLYPSSSRPSLEGGRPSLEMLEPLTKSRSQASSGPRPVSTYVESSLEFLRERETSSSTSKPVISPGHRSPRFPSSEQHIMPPPPRDSLDHDPAPTTTIESNVEFLRAMEEEPRKRDRSNSAKHHSKRSSLSSLGAGTKNILAGKFGDAFKRFEGSGSSNPKDAPLISPPASARTPSPTREYERRHYTDLTPIAGSEATDGRSDDGRLTISDVGGGENFQNGYGTGDMGNGDDIDESLMTPEMRREHEARMLAQEEARVAAAQAEYRQRVARRGVGGAGAGSERLAGGSGSGPGGIVSRAVSIQNKVQSLLSESTRSSANVTRTAHGYGPYADAAAVTPLPQRTTTGTLTTVDGRPVVPRKPLTTGSTTAGGGLYRIPSVAGATSSAPGAPGGGAAGKKPPPAPKPAHLYKTPTSGGNLVAGTAAVSITSTSTGGVVASPRPLARSPPKPSTSIHASKVRGGNNPFPSSATGPSKPPPVPVPAALQISPSHDEHQQQPPPLASVGAQKEILIAVNLPGQPAVEMTAAERDEYLHNFQKRFPSLGSIEMVERDLAAEEAAGGGAAAAAAMIKR